MRHIITVSCFECGRDFKMDGHLPTMMRAWADDQGLLCCGVQTRFTNWEMNLRGNDQ